MGLDMYLDAKKYVSGYEHNTEAERNAYDNAVSVFDNLAVLADGDTPHAEVSVCALYWRKANAIHSWFVKNVQNTPKNA